MKSRVVIFLLVGFLLVSPALAEVPIGNGLKCDGTSILKGTKTVSYSKAKSTLTQTIAKLKEKLAAAPKRKKAAIKAQLATAKQSKTLITSCFNGILDTSQVDSIFTNLASGSGTYQGDYSGTVNGIFPLTGDVTTLFALVDTTFSAVLSLGGNLGNALNAQPLHFEGDVGGISFPAQFFLQNTFMGDVTLTISQDGHLTIANSNSSTANVVFDSQFSNQTITGSINGTYNGYTFQGSSVLNREL